ncbi:ATP-binding protein [Actinomadura alba]|uniref:AAA family ATPase n=1 Tax=Actinomadura alba TaxID=406431 RepID=A0ABR7LUA8_9ACTN|nr:LuxR C-terminal-related transcriptional regulator [Actinomadura alba]MBC6468421.1 AAA family ATPase [Actinomadura alba]
MQNAQRFVLLGVGDPGSQTAHPFHSLGPLIGRSAELTALRRRVTESPERMVALTGPVGVGKSRLAAEVFKEACTSRRQGWFVDLGVMKSGDDLPERLAGALGCPEREDVPAPARLAAWWGEQDVLLVLDHCEHLMDDVVGLVRPLLAECTGLRVLVVGQEAPRMYGGSLFSLAPFVVAEERSPATLEQLSGIASIELLLHRTSVVRPGFALTDENREVVSELCRRLDGLPLAIELAAARLKLLTPGALLGELDEGLECLHGSRADTLSRHLSMSAAVAQSCDRLSVDERERFVRLAVFGGEFGITAAEAMMRPGDGPVQELLATLVDRNLLAQMERANGELGFSMLGTVRAYALALLDRMDELDRVRQSHAAYFLARARLAERELKGPGQAFWTEQLVNWDRELQRALAFFMERGNGHDAAALAVALRPYWMASGRLREGLDWLELVLAEDGVRGEPQAKVLEAAGELGAWLRCERAVERLLRAREIYRRLSDDRGAAACLHHLGLAAYIRGELGKAAGLLQDAVVARRAADDAHGHACAARDLAALRLDVGETAEARNLAEVAAEAFRRLKDARQLALTHTVLGAVAAEEGALAEAEEIADQVLRFFADGTDPIAVAGVLELTAHLLSKHGRDRERWRRCTLLLSAAHSLRAEAGCELSGHRRASRDDLAERARVRLGGSAFDHDWTEGRALSLRAAVDRALAPPPQEPTAVGDLDVGLPTPLTPREHEVAELVARGLTNREIARRLGIAEWTAVNHLRKIMRKLDCSSRVHVANWVANRQTEESAVAAPMQRRVGAASAVRASHFPG